MTDISSDNLKPRTSPPVTGIDNPPKAIAIVLLALFFFSCSDIASKALTKSLPPIQIIWMRYILFVSLIVPLALYMRGPGVFRATRLNWQLVRGVATLCSSLFFTMAFQFLPMAETMAMSFVSPIFVTALSILLLSEIVGWRRWLALLVGLMGVLIVIRPGTDAFQAAAVFPLLGAAFWAMGMIATRKTSFGDDAWTALTYSAIIGFMIVSMIVPFFWRPVSPTNMVLSSMVGCLSTLAQVIILFAYRLAPASVLAPFSYSQLIWAAIFGFIVFGEVPDRWTVIGAGVIVASGLYIAHRERTQAQETRRKIMSGS